MNGARTGCRRPPTLWRTVGRHRVAAPLLVAFFLRALVPSGFMPAAPAAPGQPLTMAMCPAHSALPRPRSAPDAPTAPGKHQESPCAFAAAAALAPLPSPPLDLPFDRRAVEPESLQPERPPARLARRAHHPRAPPTPG